MIANWLPLFLIAPVLVAVAYFDLRYMRIPNALSIVAVCGFLFLAWLLALPTEELLARFAVAGGVFAVGFLAFALRLVGGGDVKILSALMLYVPVMSLNLFAFVFAAALVVGLSLIITLRHVPVLRRSGWQSLRRDREFPMGISIALAGLVHPGVAVALSAAH